MMIMGGLLVGLSMVGKRGVKFYRAVLNKEAFSNGPQVIGRYHKGGFDDKMSRREAALILGIRETAEEKRILDAHGSL